MSEFVDYDYEAMKRFIFLSSLNEARILFNNKMRQVLVDDGVDLLSLNVHELREYLQLDDNSFSTLLRRLKRDDFHGRVMRRLDLALKKGVRALTLIDPLYPELLSHIESPPSILWVLGKQSEDALKKPAVTMVGTRSPSPYGERVSKDAARYIALRGGTVFSGMALGIDGFSHLGALQADGSTIAVVASGPEHIYPPQHVGLYEQILEKGAVISEYPPGLVSHPSRFPVRNRILAGISAVTIVVESSMRSGTLITAGFALKEGREVFAVPGNIYAPTSKGTNSLLRDGAMPLIDFNDLKRFICPELEIVVENDIQIRIPIGDNEDENAIIRMLATQNLALEELYSSGNWSMDQLIIIIAGLESKRHIMNYRGRYTLTSRVDVSI